MYTYLFYTIQQRGGKDKRGVRVRATRMGEKAFIIIIIIIITIAIITMTIIIIIIIIIIVIIIIIIIACNDVRQR